LLGFGAAYLYPSMLDKLLLSRSMPAVTPINLTLLSFISIATLVNGLFSGVMLRWIKGNALTTGRSHNLNKSMTGFFSGMTYISFGLLLCFGTVFLYNFIPRVTFNGNNLISWNKPVDTVVTLANGDKTSILTSGVSVVIPASIPAVEESMPEYIIPVPAQQVLDSSGILGSMDVPDTSPVEHIRIPAIGVDASVSYIPFAGNTWSLIGLKQQVAWLGDTSQPGLGSNTVLAGHISLSGGVPGPFYLLDEFKTGDKIYLTTKNYQYVYTYTKTMVVNPTDTYISDPSESAMLTLITCTDWDPSQMVFSKRLVISAALVSVSRVSPKL
jgi:LPXTG-site transpeptidase (sortase) family protein